MTHGLCTQHLSLGGPVEAEEAAAGGHGQGFSLIEQQVPVKIPPGGGSINSVDITIQIFLPTDPTSLDQSPRDSKKYEPHGATSSVVVFSPGFLVEPVAYASYCQALAQRGIPCVIYSKPGESATQPIDDVDSAEILATVLDWCEAEPSLMKWATSDSTARMLPGSGGRSVTPRAGISFVLAGHSRGSKISVLAASLDADLRDLGRRVTGLVLLDPVDSGYDSTEGPRYRSGSKGNGANDGYPEMGE